MESQLPGQHVETLDDLAHQHHVKYVYVFAALCVFTALSITTEIIPFPNHASLVLTVFAVATAKALCVLAFFMHLKFEGNWKYVLLAPTTVLAIGLPIALIPDVGAHYYTVDVPQLDAYEREHGEAGTPPGEEPAPAEREEMEDE